MREQVDRFRTASSLTHALCLVLVVGLLAPRVAGHAVRQPLSRPNILWISAEDISPDLGCYGGVTPGTEYARTPNLDRFAREGARFDLAFSVTPVCAPSRSSIITGCYPTAIGTMHMRSRAIPPPEVRCFTEYLRSAGYFCTNNVKTDYNFEPPFTAWDESSNRAHWRNRPDKNQPFFAVFNLVVTHESQIRAPEDVYRRNTASLTPDERHDPAKAPLPSYYPDTPRVRQDWARYSDNITAMDKQAAALLKQLDEDGLANNTLVLFWGDHGRGLPRAKRWPYDSGLRVPLLARWPGKIAPGSVRTDLVCLMDLGPTALAVAGAPVRAYMHGQPFLGSRMFGPEPAARKYTFGHRDRMDETYDRIRSVRDARYRYIRNYQPEKPYAQYIAYAEEMPTLQEWRRLHKEEFTLLGNGEVPKLLTPAQRLFMAPTKPAEEMYDLQADPFEVKNLAGSPDHASKLRELRSALKEWEGKYGDLGELPEAELIAKWRPNGVAPQTQTPVARIDAGRLTISCPTAGASIGWRSESDPTNRWRLYSSPVSTPAAAALQVRACRIGYRDSETINVSP